MTTARRALERDARVNEALRRSREMLAGLERTKGEVMSDQTKGLYRKFKVERTDGSSAVGGKHEECNYFVLDLTHDKHAIPALVAYAASCRAEFPELADDLEGIYTAYENWRDREKDALRTRIAALEAALRPFAALVDLAEIAGTEAVPVFPEHILEAARVMGKDDNPSTCPHCGGKDWHHSVECYTGSEPGAPADPGYTAQLEALLLRIRGWDGLHDLGDAMYWTGEIDKLLEGKGA